MHFEQWVITFLLQIITHAVKSPAHADSLRTQLLEVRDAINGLYPGR